MAISSIPLISDSHLRPEALPGLYPIRKLSLALRRTRFETNSAGMWERIRKEFREARPDLQRGLNDTMIENQKTHVKMHR